jgi:hypothetical protein
LNIDHSLLLLGNSINMGSAGRPVKAMQEIFRESSSQKMMKHYKMIRSFLDRGYEIESEEEFEDKGAQNEIIANRLVTVLKPISDFSLPMLKFDAAEIHGEYFDDNEEFEPFEESRFKMKAYQKGSGVKAFRDPWRPFDLA